MFLLFAKSRNVIFWTVYEEIGAEFQDDEGTASNSSGPSEFRGSLGGSRLMRRMAVVGRVTALLAAPRISSAWLEVTPKQSPTMGPRTDG